MIIGINGKKGHGKDLIGTIIQYLLDKNSNVNIHKDSIEGFNSYIKNKYNLKSNWQIKKFADKLKDIVCLLIGCTKEQLEDNNFKEKELGEEWWYWKKPITGEIIKSYKEYEVNDYILIKLTPRLLLQLIGTDCIRNIIHPDAWVNSTMSEYKPNYGDSMTEAVKGIGSDISYPSWIITDLRFPNEADAIRKKGGLLIRVERPSIVSSDSHPSETSLDNYKLFDKIIINDGNISSLIEKVKQILITYKLL